MKIPGGRVRASKRLLKLDVASVARVAVVAIALSSVAGCGSAAPPPPPGIELAPGAGVVGPGSQEAIEQAERTAAAYTRADVDFMTGMIPHHAQAVIMGGWCGSHGARSDVQALCRKIVISQRDEIRLMRDWLAERGEPVPDSTSTHVMRMGDTEQATLMPGMLTAEEMAALDAARGSDFDSLFLTGMIRHHQGAVDMVDELYRHEGAGQEEFVFRFASDVAADQSAEIHRMSVMLETVQR